MKLRKYHTLFLLLAFMTSTSLWGQSVLVKNLRLYDIAYHPSEDKIYGAYSGDQPGGHSIIRINPNNGEIESRIPVAAEPHVIRFSANFNYLYIGYLGSERLDRIVMSSGLVETVARFQFVEEYFSQTNVVVKQTNELLAIPSMPDGIVVCMRDNFTSPESEGMFVFDGQSILPNQVEIGSDASRNLAYHAGSGNIYGYGHEYRHNGGLFRYNIDANGISYDQEFGFLDQERSEIEIFGDRLYSQIGEVLDISGNAPTTIGNIYTDENRRYREGVLEIDPQSGLIYNVDYETFGAQGGAGYYLIKVNPTDLSFIERTLIPGLIYQPHKLIHTGANGRLAMIAHEPNRLRVPLRGNLVILGACADQASANLTVDYTAELSNICPDDSVQFEAGGNFAQYLWSNGLEGQQINTDFPNGFENLFVTAYDAQGCPQAVSEVLEIRANYPEVTNLEITSGQALKCASDSVILTASLKNADYLEWSTGERGPSITVKEPGEYSVLAYKNSGCVSDQRASIRIRDFPKPNIPKAAINEISPIELCRGEIATLTATDEFYSYEWNFPSFFKGRQLLTDWERDYQVRHVDINGCKGEWSEPVQVIYNNLPAPPVLQVQDSMVFTLTPGEKEWYENGVLLASQTSDTLIAVTRGFYAAVLIDDNGCRSNFSQAVRMENPFIEIASTIAGTAFVDYNQNGILDSIDFALENYWINLLPENLVRFTDEDGYFEFVRPQGNYELDIRVDTSLWGVLQGVDGHEVNTLVTPDSFYTFTIYPKVTEPRLQIDLSTGITRCNQLTPTWVSIRNVGTSAFKGELCLQLDDLITEALENGVPYEPLPEEICWSLDSLPIGQEFKRNLLLGIPGVQNIGDSIHLAALAYQDTSVVGQWQFSSSIRCAYDPNDKLVAPARGTEGQYALFDDTLRYTIRFQNTGNDTAFTVRLTDQLSDRLQWNTFNPISASHDYSVSLDLENGMLEILFENILLPDSTTNLEGSQGYFSFDILPRSDLEENTIIENFADIYFDFNPPIMTNTTSSEMVSELPIIDAVYEVEEKKHRFYFVPNPYRDQTSLHQQTALNIAPLVGRLEIYNTWGVKVWTSELGQPFAPMEVTTVDWPAGLYYYQIIRHADGKTVDSGSVVKMD